VRAGNAVPFVMNAANFWQRAVTATDGFVNDLAPMPAHAMV